MTQYNPENERIKRDYFDLLKEAKQQDESSIDAVAKALARFEVYTKYKPFKQFHKQQAIGFKKHLAGQVSSKTGDKLSKSTLHATCRHLRNFFEWLAMQRGYRSYITYGDAEYFNLSAKDTRIAKASRPKRVPSMEEIETVIDAMPSDSPVEQRNRALIAFTLLTGARDAAIASFKIKHIDFDAETLFQDAREVNTKASKTFLTHFFPVGDVFKSIVREWVDYLIEELGFDEESPIFPKTQSVISGAGVIESPSLVAEHWANADPIRTIFKAAFACAGIPYANPHSLRNTLAKFGEEICTTPEEFKAWSQNLGHEGVLTTFYSYGEVQPERQGEIIRDLQEPLLPDTNEVEDIVAVVVRELGLRGGKSRSHN